ncbi:hypothetical protein [Afipia broomeae]|uniref:hypothetical protein n=1 Tax=Afipia broomeae TaxID=56946 RepID=UPI0012F7E767|nr:hypothetical protein [Afipia broomeae]
MNNTITGRDPQRETHEDRMIEIFECLRDSVETIPDGLVRSKNASRSLIGIESYNLIVQTSIQAITPDSSPGSAAEFAEALNRVLKT